MYEQLLTELRDDVASGVVRLCREQLLFELAEMVRSGVVHVDETIGLVAGVQHGVVTWGQLVALGLKRSAIAHRVKTKRLHRIHRGTYIWGSPSPAQFAPELAAVLACGRSATLNHDSAAAMWDMRPPHAGNRHVFVGPRHVDIDGIRTHRGAPLHHADRRTLHAIPSVSPARAIVEIAADLTPEAVADAIEKGQVRRILFKPDLEAALQRAGRRPGTPTIRAILEEVVFTRSRLERTVLKLIKQARLPIPDVNYALDGDEIDFVWADLRVTLEVDGYRFHSTRAAFERDRRRDADRQRAGHVVMRATYTEIEREPLAFIARLAQVLAQAQSRLR